MQGQKRNRGGYTVSGDVSQVWQEVWEVLPCTKFRVPTRRRRRRDDSRLLGSILSYYMAGARFVLQRGGGAVRSGPVAGGAA